MERAVTRTTSWVLNPVAETRTPDPETGPWHLQILSKVRSGDPPYLCASLTYGPPRDDPSFLSWELVAPALMGAASQYWDVDEAIKTVLAEYRKTSAPSPDPAELRAILLRAAREAVLAWFWAVAVQWSEILTSEEVAEIWGEEEVRRVMSS